MGVANIRSGGKITSSHQVTIGSYVLSGLEDMYIKPFRGGATSTLKKCLAHVSLATAISCTKL